jgi:acyl-CoA hydrolase
MDKTRRQRARELIAIAHPRFREALAKEREKYGGRG